ncbi:U1 small nuclear ribonucleoprotein A [Echinococcus granulosus]|uniref:U1 small nuclear ribonucleoprotein a n=1 Tax=Echinococcus granulosus TaxID=6210 RepID=A0A068WQ96_ECHGR|nr:U1 small nuclear ribonucleoprotein A [Echinococcus granulosus]CDS20686.1 u1 small nuclear ribonucleoprotein a [Echinococcus granulosus]
MSIGAIPTAMIPPAAPGVPGHTAGMASTAPILPPNHTIYINNLNEKIKTDELKKSLYAVFVQFGQILDIITGKSVKMRGQAFVVFSEISSARSALEAMRGFPLYEKPMCINFARTTSDIIAKREGTYVERPKRQPPPPPLPQPTQQQNSTIDAAALIGGGSARAIRRRQQRLAAAQAAALAAENGGSAAGGPSPSPQSSSTSASQSHPPPINPATIPDQPPNKILFLTNLPEDANEAMLGMLFAPFVGFREIRMVPSRHDIAFVEFSSETEAATAKHGLQGFNIRPGHPLRITFAKK